MPTVSAYLVHWYAPEWCRSSVASLLASSGVDVRMTVLNNGGALDLCGGVRIVDLRGNRGFAGAVNVALDDFLVDDDAGYAFVGSHDVSLATDALELLLSAMDARPEIGVLAPMLANVGSGPRLATDGGFEERTWVSGSGLVLRKECVHDVGFFDERLGSYVEDVDYCLRARDRGWRVGWLTTAEGRQEGSADPNRAVLMTRANWVVLHCKRREYGAAARVASETGRIALRNLRRRHFRSAALFSWAAVLGPARALRLVYRRTERG